MSELETLILDEMRREFRRTRPPAKAINSNFSAAIFRLTTRQQIGYRVFWFETSRITFPFSFCEQDTLFELIEILNVL